MRIIYNPSSLDADYSIGFSGEAITATIGGATDVFDFSGMPDGATDGIQTPLRHCPVISAERVNGDLTVQMIHWYGPEPQYQPPEPLYPDAPVEQPPPVYDGPPEPEPVPVEGDDSSRYEAALAEFQAAWAAHEQALDDHAEAWASAQAEHADALAVSEAQHARDIAVAEAAHAEARAAWLEETQVREVIL